MRASLVAMLVSIDGVLAVSRADGTDQAGDNSVCFCVRVVLAICSVIGLISITTAEPERRCVMDRHCAAGEARICETMKERANSALGLVEKLLKRDIRDKLPCLKAPSSAPEAAKPVAVDPLPRRLDGPTHARRLAAVVFAG